LRDLLTRPLAERIVAFKSMLATLRLDPQKDTFDSTLGRLAKAPEYRLLNTLQEKRAAFDEYLVQLRQEQRQQHLQQQKQHRDAFYAMLWSSDFPSSIALASVKSRFCTDPRWTVYGTDDALRQRLLTEWCNLKREKERLDRQRQEDVNKEALRAKLLADTRVAPHMGFKAVCFPTPPSLISLCVLLFSVPLLFLRCKVFTQRLQNGMRSLHLCASRCFDRPKRHSSLAPRSSAGRTEKTALPARELNARRLKLRCVR
jgi:hypothetical protein